MKPHLGVALVMMILAGCRQDTPAWKKHGFSTKDQSRSAFSARLPRSLWDKITSLVAALGPVEVGHAAGESQDGSPKRIGQLPSVFAPIRVYLIEKNHGILNQGHTEIILPAGGGEIDLSEFIQPKNGSFYFAAEFMPGIEKLERKVFFLSNAPERDLDGERFGAGCDTYFDISTAFQKAMARDGFLLNTTDGRHVSALAGTYFFAAAHEGKLYLASLTVKDSVRRKLQCPPKGNH